MTRLLAIACFVAVTVGPIGSADAQIVNVLGKIKDADGFTGQLGLSFGFKTGNTTLVQAKGELGAGYRYEDHLVYLVGKAQFGTKQSIEKLSLESFDKDFVHISRIFGHLRYRYTVLDWFDLEGFAQSEADRFRDLGLRMLFGVGPRISYEPIDGLYLAVGSAYMLEHERYNKSLVTAVTSHRWSNYVQASYKFDDTFSISNTTFFQPRIAGDVPIFDLPETLDEVPIVSSDLVTTQRTVVSDLRISSESALTISVNSWLKIKLSLNLGLNSNTPPQPEDLARECVDDSEVCPGLEVRDLATGFDKKVKPLDVGFDTKFILTL